MWYEEILTIMSGWNSADIWENIYIKEQKTSLPILDKAMDIIERMEMLKETENKYYIEIVSYMQEKNQMLELENKKLKDFISKNSGIIFTKENEIKGITKKLTIEEINILSLLK